MGISLFGIKNSEYKKPKVHCKCRFEIKKLSINPIFDSKTPQVIIGCSLAFKIDYQKGKIAYSMIETNLVEEDFQSKKIILLPILNEQNNNYTCSIAFAHPQKRNIKLKNIFIKLVNLCNDTTIFTPQVDDYLQICNEMEVELQKQSKFYLG